MSKPLEPLQRARTGREDRGGVRILPLSQTNLAQMRTVDMVVETGKKVQIKEAFPCRRII